MPGPLLQARHASTDKGSNAVLGPEDAGQSPGDGGQVSHRQTEKGAVRRRLNPLQRIPVLDRQFIDNVITKFAAY